MIPVVTKGNRSEAKLMVTAPSTSRQSNTRSTISMSSTVNIRSRSISSATKKKNDD